MHKFRELKVYQKSIAFSHHVRSLTKTFPREELFVLTAQFRRAADSVILNIAEGSGNYSSKEFIKFLSYSIRSGYECVACSDIALNEGFVNTQQQEEIFQEIDEIIAMLIGLQNSIIKRSQRKP